MIIFYSFVICLLSTVIVCQTTTEITFESLKTKTNEVIYEAGNLTEAISNDQNSLTPIPLLITPFTEETKDLELSLSESQRILDEYDSKVSSMNLEEKQIENEIDQMFNDRKDSEILVKVSDFLNENTKNVDSSYNNTLFAIEKFGNFSGQLSENLQTLLNLMKSRKDFEAISVKYLFNRTNSNINYNSSIASLQQKLKQISNLKERLNGQKNHQQTEVSRISFLIPSNSLVTKIIEESEIQKSEIENSRKNNNEFIFESLKSLTKVLENEKLKRENTQKITVEQQRIQDIEMEKKKKEEEEIKLLKSYGEFAYAFSPKNSWIISDPIPISLSSMAFSTWFITSKQQQKEENNNNNNNNNTNVISNNNKNNNNNNLSPLVSFMSNPSENSKNFDFTIAISNCTDFTLRLNSKDYLITSLDSRMLCDANWHQVVVVWDSVGGEFVLFIDGKFQNRRWGIANNQLIEAGSNVILGNYPLRSADNFDFPGFTGGMRNAFLVTGIVTPMEVLRFMQKTEYSGKLKYFHWKLNQTNGDSINDIGTLHVNGKANGGKWFQIPKSPSVDPVVLPEPIMDFSSVDCFENLPEQNTPEVAVKKPFINTNMADPGDVHPTVQFKTKVSSPPNPYAPL